MQCRVTIVDNQAKLEITIPLEVYYSLCKYTNQQAVTNQQVDQGLQRTTISFSSTAPFEELSPDDAREIITTDSPTAAAKSIHDILPQLNSDVEFKFHKANHKPPVRFKPKPFPNHLKAAVINDLQRMIDPKQKRPLIKHRRLKYKKKKKKKKKKF